MLRNVFDDTLTKRVFVSTLIGEKETVQLPISCLLSVGGIDGKAWNYNRKWVATCPMMEDQ